MTTAQPRTFTELYEADARHATAQVRPFFDEYKLCTTPDDRFAFLDHPMLMANPYAPCLISVDKGNGAAVKVVFGPLRYMRGPPDRPTLHYNQVYAVERVRDVLDHPIVEVCQLDKATLFVSATQNVPFNQKNLNEALVANPDNPRLPL